MNDRIRHILMLSIVLGYACTTNKKRLENKEEIKFPDEVVKFSPIDKNPVFQGTAADTWDQQIRERGYILFENGVYKMWYTGYNDSLSELRYLGYATSKDGIEWDRYSNRPLKDNTWIEDMQVIKKDNRYFMVAEGRNDIAHLLTSDDGLSWEDQGDFVILQTDGNPIEKGPYGTPTVWVEDGINYLFYERDDLAIWLAKSKNFKEWTNVQDEPILERGPEAYDKGAVAVNQVIKYKDSYYMYYHASTSSDWMDPNALALWSSNIAVSTNLIDWKKFPENPIVEGDHSSPIVVYDEREKRYILYTMHDKVWRFNPVNF